MNFENLLSIAENNKVNLKQLPKFGTELPAPKKEKKEKPKSETVRKLIEEKDRERREKEEYERRKKKEKEKRRLEEEKKKRFVIPRKKQDDSNSASPASSSHSNIDNIITGEGSSRNSSPSISSRGGSEKHSDIKDRDKDRTSHSDKSGKHRESSSSASRHHSSGRTDKTDKSSSDKMINSHSKSSLNSEKHSKHKADEKRHENIKSHKGESSHSSSKHKSESSSKHKHSSSHNESSKASHSSHNASKSSSDKNSKSGKDSTQELTLEELRAQVKQMKKEAEEIEKPINNTSSVKSNVNPHLFEPHKNRHGVEVSEAEKRKAQILTKTQLILQRTKERLAMAKEAERQPKKRLGKTSSGVRKEKDEGGQIKSKSLCKDDDSDEDEPVNINFENSFNEEYLTQEPGSILKTIKSKIDEKLSSYNFPDKPAKERSPQKRREKHAKERHEKHDRERNEKSLKERMKKHKHKLMEELKNEDRRELFGDRNSDSFHSGDDLNKNKTKKNKIVKRHQAQPPPMNFQDLLKLAESKSKEKVVEDPVFLPPKPKKEERPMTQEERERLERQKESRRRAREEELEMKKGNLPDGSNDRPSSHRTELADRVNSWLADSKKSGLKPPEKDGSKLKAALTGNSNKPSSAGFTKPGMISSKPSAFAKQNMNQEKEKSSKYDSENENVLSCKPSSSKGSKPLNPYKDQSTNPWDRITGHMKKSNPKPEKRKHEVMESSEEEDEYDEDDDFIDDDDAGQDYSAHIRQIFGYDKRKYKDEDDDDDNMEVGFSTIMKEEARSAKIGLQEDLEDIRREEEELRQKKLAKMKKMRR